jgi:hypothetical protein
MLSSLKETNPVRIKHNTKQHVSIITATQHYSAKCGEKSTLHASTNQRRYSAAASKPTG